MLYLVGSFLLFIVLLFIIVLFVFKKSKNQGDDVKQKSETTATLTLESLIKTLKTEKQELAKIDGLAETMAQNFPFPEKEKEAGRHFEFVYFYAKNPLTTAKMIVHMQNVLTLSNPKYAKQIEEFQMRGVEARTK